MRMGSETEFGIAGGWGLDKALAIQRVVEETHAWLPSAKGGIFLGNGAQIYIDQGRQNEYATPEVDSPRALVIHELAGRRIMAEAAESAGYALLCSNVDPDGGATWGNHENYEMRYTPTPEDLRVLSLHLATRIVFTGAGGLDPFCDGIAPVLSPRACRVSASLSRQGRARKTLVFVKPNHYGKGYRLHVFCGECLLSHHASFLKYASTALLAAALDERLPIVWPRFDWSPIQVLRQINRDVALRRRYRMADGRMRTALEIQKDLVEALAPHTDRLPDWAEEALMLWRRSLDEITKPVPGADGRYDWRLLLDLLDELAGASDVERSEIEVFNQELRLRSCGGKRTCLLAGKLFALRAAANEAYIRLHVLGRESLFDRLAGERGFDHAVSGVTEGEIGNAMTTPPPGRAARRASLIRRASHFPNTILSWDVLRDGPNGRYLLVPDNETTDWETRWIPELPPNDTPTVEALFRRGHYAECIKMLGPQMDEMLQRRNLHGLETLYLSYSRTGRLADMAALLDRFARAGADRFRVISLELFCRMHESLAPNAERLYALVEEGLPLAAERMPDETERVVFDQCRGVVLAATGDIAGGLRVLDDLIAREANGHRPRMLARSRCYAGELRRRLGDPVRADDDAVRAMNAYMEHNMEGDMAMHSMPLLARLADDQNMAAFLYQESERIALETTNPLTMAKVRCLYARQFRRPGDRDAVMRAIKDVPSLNACPIAARIEHEWESWSAGPGPDTADDYWGIL